MGDPKKNRKKFSKPAHPWNKERIEAESVLMKEYGFKNKKELWKMTSKLSTIKRIAKKNIAAGTKQAEKERAQQIKKLQKLGLATETTSVDEILGVTLRDMLEKRLQTVVYKKGFARSVTQARQFITHGHIRIGERKVDSPSYLVGAEELPLVTFKQESTLSSIEHPERIILEKKEVKKVVKDEFQRKDGRRDNKRRVRKDGAKAAN